MPGKNGAGTLTEPTPTATQPFNIRHRRSELVNVTADEPEPTLVLVRAMSAGERRRFLAKGTEPNPNDPTGDEVIARRWYNSGDRARVLLALSCIDQAKDTYLFPEAATAALQLLDGNTVDRLSLLTVDDIDPAAEVLLLAAAERVSLITVVSVEKLQEGPKSPDPLVSASVSSSSLEKPSGSPTPSSS